MPASHSGVYPRALPVHATAHQGVDTTGLLAPSKCAPGRVLDNSILGIDIYDQLTTLPGETRNSKSKLVLSLIIVGNIRVM